MRRSSKYIKNKLLTCAAAALLALCVAAAGAAGVIDYLIPGSLTTYDPGNCGSGGLFTLSHEGGALPASASTPDVPAVTKEVYTAKLFGMLPVKEVDVSVVPKTYLIPGGINFGVKFFTQGLLVVGLADIDTDKGAQNPAKSAGIYTSDIITKINGAPVKAVEDAARYIEKSGGSPLEITFARGDKTYTAQVTPVLSSVDGKYKTGMWLRDSTAGIGTVTFIYPDSNAFGGLGHGICDVDTGSLMPLGRGTVVDAEIIDTVKGKPDAPGELKGRFKDNIGTLLANTNSGVFGILTNLPPSQTYDTPMPIALSGEVREGKAYIMATVDDGGVRQFGIEIVKIYKNSGGSKNFLIKVTDQKLLDITGGIVQGMSGSPIIQNGKLVGAVTHVLISDPKKGYGIFIENMLSEMPEILK